MANDEILNLKTLCGPEEPQSSTHGSGEPQSPTIPATPKPGVVTQRVGHNNGKQSAKPRDTNKILPNDMNTRFEQLFGPKRFNKYYTIKSINDANLTQLNMFKVDKAITQYIGRCEKLTEEFNTKSWTVEVRTEEQGEKLMQMTELLREPVTVTPHEHHNQSQGVITCALLKGYSDEDIAEGLAEQGVTCCRRIIRRPKSEQPEPTTTLILTFNTSNPPDRIVIRTGLVERVRPYIPLPRRCFKCHNYGHSGAKCRRQLGVCIQCGGDLIGDHKSETCQLPVQCIHCHQPHSVTSRTCPRYLLEKEILAIKTKEHLTFAEARSKVNLNIITTNKTYATATVTGNRPNEERRKTTDENNNSTIRQTQNTTQQQSKRRLDITHSPTTDNEIDLPDIDIPIQSQQSLTRTGSQYASTSTEPPDKKRYRKSSNPNLTSTTQKENDLLNTVRKANKDKKKDLANEPDKNTNKEKRPPKPT